MIKVVYFSSSHRALPGLKIINQNLDVVGIVTQPAKPTGRKQELIENKIAEYAQEEKIPLLKPEKLGSEAVAWIKDKNPDVLLLAYYGELIPEELFNITPSGILVTHPSLLPRWRWGSPIQATIISGEEAGVGIMKMDEKFDHGPLLASEKVELKEDDDQETAYTHLFAKGAQLAVKILPDYLSGKLKPQEQDHTKATFAKHVKKEDGFIPGKYLNAALKGETVKEEWFIPFMFVKGKDKTGLSPYKTLKPYSLQPTPHNLNNFIRAMHPWPGAWTYISVKGESKKRLKILKAHLEKDPTSNAQRLMPSFVQLEGKTPVSWKQFTEAYPENKFKE